MIIEDVIQGDDILRNKILVVLVLILMIFLVSSNILAQDNLSNELFDLSKYEDEIKESGIPAPEWVESLKNSAMNLFNEGSYQKAEKALDKCSNCNSYRVKN